MNYFKIIFQKSSKSSKHKDKQEIYLAFRLQCCSLHQRNAQLQEILCIYTKTTLQTLWIFWLMVFMTAGLTVHDCAGVDMMVFPLS